MIAAMRQVYRFIPAIAVAATLSSPAVSQNMGLVRNERETHLRDVRQLTFGGENAEAYWSPDGSELIFQSTRDPYGCDQIFRMPISDPAALTLLSTGRGRTTCGYFTADNERVIFSSTHSAGDQCPTPPDRSRGYVWPVYDTYQIYSAQRDGTGLVQLTDTDAYDAEATVCSRDGSIIFTSSRDGDLDLYRMDADGANVKRLTDGPGYDGGAFFSPDCSKVVWRASRPAGASLADYRSLLADELIRPGELELWVADADGSQARQITYLGGANFAPFFFPSGERIIFSSNHDDPDGREFDLWAVNIDGTDLERITYTEGFDGFPMFSPDGEWLAFGSNRNQSGPGDTDIYIARWIDNASVFSERPPDRYLADVEWLADDERTGRGLGTQGLAAAAAWLEQRFEDIGLEPAGSNSSYRQSFEAVVDVKRGSGTALLVHGVPLPADDFVILGFSASGKVVAPVVFAGWGIDSQEHGVNDYDGIDVEGRIVLVRRYAPRGGIFEDEKIRRRFSDLRYKAFTAREHGALGLLVADLPLDEKDEEPSLPRLRVDPQVDVGIPVAVIKREWAESMLTGEQEVVIVADLVEQTREIHNIVGRLAAAERLPGSVLLGAHYDHLGWGGENSLSPDLHELHNGADDNASGTAALLEVARILVNRREELKRDAVFVAFTGEEAAENADGRHAGEPVCA